MYHHIWFERALPDDFRTQIDPGVAVRGPGTAEDPFLGIETAGGILASVLVYTAEVLDRASNALVVARTGIGVDGVDLAAATSRGIAVCNTPDAPTVSTAEHAVALMLAVAKRTAVATDALRNARGNYYSDHQAIELEGKTLGLVGYGRIARRVAQSAVGLGMMVMAHDPFLPGEETGVTSVDTLDELVSAADVVSIHVPLTPETRHLFDGQRLRAMRPGSILVNTSRGGVIDQEALIEVLESGHLFGAGLDVTEPEPLPPDHPLLRRDDVVVTPHVASGTMEGKARIFRMALAQVLAVLNGQRPQHLVNPEVWPRVEERMERGLHGGT